MDARLDLDAKGTKFPKNNIVPKGGERNGDESRGRIREKHHLQRVRKVISEGEIVFDECWL